MKRLTTATSWKSLDVDNRSRLGLICRPVSFFELDSRSVTVLTLVLSYHQSQLIEQLVFNRQKSLHENVPIAVGHGLKEAVRSW